MPSISIKLDPQKFAPGVSVGVYAPPAGWSTDRASGPPPGSLLDTQVAGASSTVFASLQYGVEYVAYAGAPDRYWQFEASGTTLSIYDRVAQNTAALAALGTPISGMSQAFGSTGGVAAKPWATPPPIGPELAVAANLKPGFNQTLPIPTLTANGVAQNNRTLISLGNLSNQDLVFRVKLNVVSMATNGWASVRFRVVDSGGVILAGTTEQMVATNGGGIPLSGWHEMDFKAGSWAVGGTYLEVRLDLFNNATTGSLQVASLSCREGAVVQRPMLYTESQSGAPGFPQIVTPLFDPAAEKWRSTITDLGTDAALTVAPTTVVAYNTDRPFRYDGPDPGFTIASGSVTDQINAPDILLAAGEVARSMRVNNNDQIMEVQKADLSYELRCNTHGGETLRSTSSPNLVYEVDRGDGTWVAWNGLGKILLPCRRFRLTYNTKITRSAPDSDDFANVNHTATFFPDGVMRVDRTTTFLKAMRVKNLFEWMSSHDITVPAVGRMGSGTQVLDEVDIYPKVATPAAPTVTTATTGGTLAAATYAYAVTALATGGETAASPTGSVTTTGSASTATVAWTGVANATGYRVYGRVNSVGVATLLATVGPAAVSWIDDGSAAGVGVPPPVVNRARRLDAATIAQDSAVSDHASWAVWFDQLTGVCFGHIYDREAVALRPGVAAVKSRLLAGSGIRKNYLTVHWTGDGSPFLPDGETRLVPSGEVWTATHYALAYVPADPVNYHLEIAGRASTLSALSTAYPAT